MARFEAALRTTLGFYTGRYPLAAHELPKPHTVSIEFESRTFVWHALLPSEPLFEGEQPYEWGPSVSVVVDDNGEREAAELLQRLLSALVFRYETPIEAVSYGGSGETNPTHPAVTRARRASASIFLVPTPRQVELDNDPRARLAVAVYREGVNAGSPSYRFLAFWNVLEAVHNGKRHKVDGFLKREGEPLLDEWFDGRPPRDLASYLRDDARNAVAHVIRSDPTNTAIDPDLPEDRVRLERDSIRLRRLAKLAIHQAWTDPVRIYERPS